MGDGLWPEVGLMERQRKTGQEITETSGFQPVVCGHSSGVAKRCLEELVTSMQRSALWGRNLCLKNWNNSNNNNNNNTKKPSNSVILVCNMNFYINLVKNVMSSMQRDSSCVLKPT